MPFSSNALKSTLNLSRLDILAEAISLTSLDVKNNWYIELILFILHGIFLSCATSLMPSINESHVLFILGYI